MKWKEKQWRLEKVEEDTSEGPAGEDSDDEREGRREETPGGTMSGEQGEDPGEQEIASLEEAELFGQKVGYSTARRPVDYLRELSTKPWPNVEEWFKTFGVTIGPMADEERNSTDQATA